MQPPIAQQLPQELTAHGETRIDPYYWMRDREDSRVREYLEAENAYTEHVLGAKKDLEEKIYREILGRIKQTDLTVPARNGPFLYYARFEEGQQYPVYARKVSEDAPEEILLDCNVLAEGLEYFQIGGFRVSDDHKLLAYSVDTDGSESYTIRVKDLVSGALLADVIPQVHEGVNWAADNATLFYTTYDETRRPEHVKRHRLGTDAATDPIVFTEADRRFTFGVGRTRSKKYLIIESVNASETSEVWYLDAHHAEAAFQVIEPRQDGVEYYADHQGERFLIRSDAGGQVNFEMFSAPLDAPGRANWRLEIGHREDATLDNIDPFEKFLVLEYRERGLPQLYVCDLERGGQHAIEFPDAAYDVHLEGNAEYATGMLRFHYTSLLTPASVYDYDMRTRQRVLKKQTEVLGGFDPDRYATARLYATADDGKRIPISLLHAVDLKVDGANPLLLYGYGSYGINMDPAFSHAVFSLVDRGWVYAIAHVRGGSEMGRAWFESGRLLEKRNTFTDFIRCAEHLIEERFTRPEKLAIMGGSAGGLLVGAVINLRPGLFHAAVARVPFVDVVTTMLDPSIPLTTGEYDQWGNPVEKQFYEYMKSYSPYDNVRAQDYPNLLITTGLNDPRVAYWEPAKWAARLRTMKTNDALVLLKTYMGAGHGGASGRYEKIRETAMIYAFLVMVVGERGGTRE